MPQVEVTAADHVLEIRVNRADKMNALSPQMYEELSLALGALDRDPALRVGLIHAEGKHFSGGIELDKWFPVIASGKKPPIPEGGLDPMVMSGPRCSKPLVMAVQGYCYTWGVELMLCTEVRIAADDTKFAMLEVARGLYPFGGATIRLPKQMGWSNAQRYLLTGESWTAAEAYRTGLVQEVVPPGQQLAKAREIAQKIAAAAPMGVRAVLKNSRLAELEGEDAARSRIFEDMPAIIKSADAQEGIKSFIERRAAKFTGK